MRSINVTIFLGATSILLHANPLFAQDEAPDPEPVVDCEEVPETPCLDAYPPNGGTPSAPPGGTGDGLSPEELERALDDAAKRLGMPELEFEDPDPDDPDSGSTTGEITLPGAGGDRTVRIRILPPNPNANKDGLLGYVEGSIGATSELWTITIWPKTANDALRPLDQPGSYGALVDILMHELMHVCLSQPSDGDSVDVNEFSAEHFVIDANLAKKLCEIAEELSEHIDDLEAYIETCLGDVEEPNEEQQKVLDEYEAAREKKGGVCDAAKEKSEKWNSHDGNEAANGFDQETLDGEVAGNGCGIEAPQIPDGGYDSTPDEGEEPEHPIPPCDACE